MHAPSVHRLHGRSLALAHALAALALPLHRSPSRYYTRYAYSYTYLLTPVLACADLQPCSPGASPSYGHSNSKRQVAIWPLPANEEQ